MNPDLPIRVFIGSSAKNRIEERVFVQSLREHTSRRLEIHVIDGASGTVTLDSGETLTSPARLPDDLGGVTAFSLGRFAIPEWCGYRGRAIYCDSDQLVFADIAELWERDLAGKAVAAVRVRDAISAPAYVDHFLGSLMGSSDDLFLTSVMLMDCEKLAAWSVGRIASALHRRELDYVRTLFLARDFRSAFGTAVERLPPEWNSLDVVRSDTKLLHFTDLTSQPWLHPHNPASEAWDREFLRALRGGLISRSELQDARDRGVISRRVQRIVDVPEALRPLVYRAWRLGEQAGNEARRVAEVGAWSERRPTRVALDAARELLTSVESRALPDFARELQKRRPRRDRIAGLSKVLVRRVAGGAGQPAPEVAVLIYSAAGERVLTPVADALARGGRGRVTIVALRELADGTRRRLLEAGCRIDHEPSSLVRAWDDPEGKVVVACLDHRLYYEHHRLGVDLVDALRARGVKTVCVQHGGCRSDSVASLASSASERLLVWGEATRRMLMQEHGVSGQRIALVGNPVHDGIRSLDDARALAELRERRPGIGVGHDGRKIVVLATTVQREYSEYPDEHERYARYVEHVYASLDYARMILVVKAHPCDPTGADDLYERLRSRAADPDSVLLIGADDPRLDVYALLHVADLVISRCSTVMEEALLMGKKLVAFDLEPDGWSKYYRHLERFGDYRTVYASPSEALSSAVLDALFSDAASGTGSDQDVERELTLALDGQSSRRAAAAIWREAETLPTWPEPELQRI